MYLKGILFSTLFGLENRVTKDIDTAIKDANFNKDNIEKMIKEIISIDINDNAKIDFVDINNLRRAVEKTFRKREYNGDMQEVLNVLKESEILKRYWKLYTKKYKYANNIEYDEIMNCVEEIINNVLGVLL